MKTFKEFLTEASKGLNTWNRHYKGKGEIHTVISAPTIFVSPEKPIDYKKGIPAEVNDEIIVHELKSEQEYLSYLPPTRKPGPNAVAFVPVTRKEDGKTYLVDFSFVSKPIEKKDLKLQTANLVKGKQIEEHDVLGFEGVKCVSFNSAQQLRQTVLQNIESLPSLKSAPIFKKDIMNYFSGGDSTKIEWSEATSDSEKAQFAKYIGELIIGLVIMENKQEVISGTNPFKGKHIQKFVVPVDQGFPAIDSFFITHQGEIIPISSKAGNGAFASAFMNIFPIILDHPEIMDSSSYLKDVVVPAMNRKGITADSLRKKKGAKETVYEVGVRDILGIGPNIVHDSYDVFNEFKRFNDREKYSPGVQRVYDELQAEMKRVGNKTALEKLDSSTTMFFCYEIIKRLNADKSVDQMLKVLAGKSYYQANMNTTDLYKNGQIKFKMVLSGEAKLKIVAGKTGYTDIDASSGTINFELKYIEKD